MPVRNRQKKCSSSFRFGKERTVFAREIEFNQAVIPMGMTAFFLGPRNLRSRGDLQQRFLALISGNGEPNTNNAVKMTAQEIDFTAWFAPRQALSLV